MRKKKNPKFQVKKLEFHVSKRQLNSLVTGRILSAKRLTMNQAKTYDKGKRVSI